MVGLGHPAAARPLRLPLRAMQRRPGQQPERHHRQRRQVGGDRLSNLLALHSLCHRYITEHPTEAEANGWIVSSHGPGGVAPDPAAAPVRIRGALWLLDDDGGKRPLP